MRNVIIGTAGHVDHGKTEIIKALTGRDTDRLVEEKERGISIVLGFASIDLGEGLNAGVIDVPGHERFVKNMVSGACGVDLALLVVAADEGVMPQTEEHLEVLKLLGVGVGVVAITKTDLAEPDVVDIVKSEIMDIVRDGPLGGAPVVPTSVVTGEGLDSLREALREQALKVEGKDDADMFRMPVDRVFTRKGIGTIVTGTTWSGTVSRGDRLIVEPRGTKVHVREVHSFDSPRESIGAGNRAALALRGASVDEIATGSQVMSPGRLEVSSMLNASIRIGALAGSRLKNRQRVRFHHAAAEIIARVILPGGGDLAAGERGFIQLRLEKPTAARRGDRFILRTYSPMRVVAGGTMLDPTAVKTRHLDSRTAGALGKLDEGSDGDVVLVLASRGGKRGVSAGSFTRYGLKPESVDGTVEELERTGRIVSVTGTVFSVEVVEAAEVELDRILSGFASEKSLQWGMDREELRARLDLGNSKLFELLLDRGVRDGRLFFKGGLVRTGGSERTLSEEESRRLGDIEKAVLDAGFEFIDGAVLLGMAGGGDSLASYMNILLERGAVVRVSQDGFIHGDRFSELLEWLGERLAGGGTVSIGDFKESFGFSRKYAVPLLEYLDDRGITRREGNVRKAGHRLPEVLDGK